VAIPPLPKFRFDGPKTGKRFIFLTNNFVLAALTITELCRCRRGRSNSSSSGSSSIYVLNSSMATDGAVGT
jgi:hypothetical protein